METTSDPVALVRATDRRVVPTQVNGMPARVVTASRTYQADIADVWDALTSAGGCPAGSHRSAVTSSSAAAIRSRGMPAARSRPASRRGGSR